MQLKLPVLTLCLLGTVLLCVVQGQDTTTVEIPTTAGTTIDQSTTAAPTTAADTGPTTDGPTTAADTGPTTDGPTTDGKTVPTKPEPTKPEPTKPDATTEDAQTGTTEALGKGPEPLSDGAIAGIAIGSIAGVAAVGGGIFGALKYTKRI